MRHNLDPADLHQSADRLGDAVASGEMSDAAASAAIVSWASKALGVDRSGLQARLHWTMRDRAEAARRARENAATAIKWAVRPLFDARAPSAEIEAAADAANGDILDRGAVVAILRAEMQFAIRRRRG